MIQPQRDDVNRTVRFVAMGVVSASIYAIIAHLSKQFDSPLDPHLRPLLSVLLLFAAATLVYLVACRVIWGAQRAIQERPRRISTMATIVGFGILFRLMMVFSIPIQEIDLYRYILDGAVSNAGEDPYDFAPQEVNRRLLAQRSGSQQGPEPAVVFARDQSERERLGRLAEYLAERPGLRECVGRVHWGRYTTPYPPVSQAVFRLATALVPQQASAYWWMVTMKATLIVFDVLTGFLLMALLARVSLPVSYSLLYWWCPLVIKEIANSGHLDSIAICLTVAFAYLAVRGLWPARDEASIASNRRSLAGAWSMLAAATLGLAVAAKVYPLVLAPAWTIAMLRRGGWRAIVPVHVFVVVAAVALWPMLRRTELVQSSNPAANLISPDDVKPALTIRPDDQRVAQLIEQRRADGLPEIAVRRRPEAGVEVFSKFWEMNDLIFMFIVENVRPNQPTTEKKPWFLVTSEAWRTDLSKELADRAGMPIHQVPFALTRRLTLLLYCLLTVGFCVAAWRADSGADWLAVLFYSIAWFWMLSPTQNPWYWCWAVPFVAFLKRPAPWLVLGGMLFLYYLRFYFEQHYANTNVAGTGYHSFLFFDFVIPWIEFGPIYLWLLAMGLAKIFRRRAEETEALS